MSLITHYPYLPLRQLHRLSRAGRRQPERVRGILEEHFQRPVVVLNSGRTAIYLALAAMGLHRNDEVFVPPFLSHCVLGTMTRVAMPALQPSPRTRAIMVVHQFGYPQQMEPLLAMARRRGWFVLEDCAYSLASGYRGKLLGLYGDAAIYSFPKTLGTVLGGCLVTDNSRILDFAREYMRARDRLGWKLFSNLSLLPVAMVYAGVEGKAGERATQALEMAYSRFVEFPNPNPRVCKLFPLTRLELQATWQARRRNLQIFASYFQGSEYPEDLESESEVVPFTVPYFHAPEMLSAVLDRLRSIRVKSDMYHFDVRRNLLAPDYRLCIPVPVHQNISESFMRTICETIRAAVGKTLAQAASPGMSPALAGSSWS